MKHVLVTVALLAAGPAAAQPIDWSGPPALLPERPFTPPSATRLRLANGMAVLVVEKHDLPLYTMQIVVQGAGSTGDPRGHSGLAAFTADMVDEGTAGMTSVEVAERIERQGATMSIWAEEDAAFVEVSGLARTFAPTLHLVAEVVSAPAFDERDAARVHSHRMTALALRRDEPGEVAGLILDGGLQGRTSAYGHPPAGYAADVARLGAADARAFYAARWDPARMTIVVAGDLSAGEVETVLARELGGWRHPGGPAAAVPVAATPATRARLLIVDKPMAGQSNLEVGAIGVKRGDPRAYAVEVTSTILGGTFSSRLSRRLREQLGYTYGASATASFLHETGWIVLATALFTPRTGAGLRELLQIVDELGRRPVPDVELAKAKGNLIRQLPQWFETDSAIADAYAGVVTGGLRDDWFAGYAGEVARVSADDVRRVARTVLARKNLVFVLVADLAVVRRSLAGLGLGTPKLFDPDGQPLP